MGDFIKKKKNNTCKAQGTAALSAVSCKASNYARGVRFYPTEYYYHSPTDTPQRIVCLCDGWNSPSSDTERGCILVKCNHVWNGLDFTIQGMMSWDDQHPLFGCSTQKSLRGDIKRSIRWSGQSLLMLILMERMMVRFFSLNFETLTTSQQSQHHSCQHLE